MTAVALAQAEAVPAYQRLCEHEARHAAGTVLTGMIPARVEAGPAGGVMLNDWERYMFTAELAPGMIKAVLAGPLGEEDVPAPEWPVDPSLGQDEQALAALAEYVGLDHGGYRQAVIDTYFLMATREFSRLEHLFAYALEHWGVLTSKDIEGLLRYIDQEEEPT
jgi:hypothetical protein